MRRAQVSIEFVMIMVFMLFLFAVLFVAIQHRMVLALDIQNLESMRQVGNVVASEVQMAEMVGDGYSREFYLVANINGEEYNVSIKQKLDLVVEYREQQYVTFLDSPVESPLPGGVVTGLNTITNVGGVVWLNPVP